jgi:hypothetical protein
MRRPLYIACAEGEETLAEEIAKPLREAGYDVTHGGTVLVGESIVGEASRILAAGSAVVLCATRRAVGSEWAHKVVNAGHASDSVRVFVVQMEKGVYVDQLALRSKVACYVDDPEQAVRELIAALAKHYPPQKEEPRPDPDPAASRAGPSEFMDEPTELAVLDTSALERFRQGLRLDAAQTLPSNLTDHEFLGRAGLLAGRYLTRTGTLLFAENPSALFPSCMVKCARYYGIDRAAPITHYSSGFTMSARS